MSNRAVLVSVGVLFSIYCLGIAILTFIGFNFATFHLSSFLVAGFAAVYGVISPIGLSGILGGLHRKKSLVKGFMFQYWFATGLAIGISVANILLSDELRTGAIRKCQTALFGVVSGQDALISCTAKVKSSESAALIFASVQGSVLIFFGFLVLFFGIKEFKDILLEEETRNLLEKAKFQEDQPNSSSDTESNISGGSNNANSNTSADNGRYAVSASVSRASSRSDREQYASTNVSRASSRSDQDRFARSNRQNNVSQNRTPGVPSPYSTPANNTSTSRINVTTNRGIPPGQYQPPPGHYQQTMPKNNYPPSNKNNYSSSSNKNNYPSSSNKNNYPSSSNKNNYPSSSNKNNYPSSSNKNNYPSSSNKNYPPSSKNNYLPSSSKNNYPPLPSNNNYPPLPSNNNYPLSSKSNSSPINGSNRSGQTPSNSKLNNYSSSQPLPLEKYSVASPERSYAADRYGPQTSGPSAYSSPLINFAGKNKPSVGQPTVQPSSSNRNYPPSTRQPAMMPPPLPVSASRPQQKIQKGYQEDGNDYDYANDYNDYIIPLDTYVQPR